MHEAPARSETNAYLDVLLDEVRATGGHGVTSPKPGMLLDLDVICAAAHDYVGPVGAYEITEVAGITYRQLDYATRTGRLHARQERAGSGNPREYPPEELAVAVVLAYLGELRTSTRAHR